MWQQKIIIIVIHYSFKSSPVSLSKLCFEAPIWKSYVEYVANYTRRICSWMFLLKCGWLHIQQNCTTKYTYPSGSRYERKSYSSITSSVMSRMLIDMNYGDSRRELVYMLLMAPAAYHTLGVDMLLLRWALVVSISLATSITAVSPS